MTARREDESSYMEDLIADIDFISGEVDSLQRGNWASKVSLMRLLKNLLYSRLLYRLSKAEWFSPRRRARFFKSAEKRDPLLLVQKVDEFCVKYYRRINENALLGRALEIGNNKGLKVTAIVPNYNHSKYLSRRLDSIIDQTYPLIDIIILDDCSTDNSVEVIESYIDKYPTRIKAVYSTKNSGNIFRQWRKGYAQATGDIVWICESDDFCEPTFVERAIRAFRDQSVMLSFGSVQYADANGKFVPGLDDYREDSEPGIWDRTTVRPAFEWFSRAFGVKNVIPNVGGSLWRRHDIDENVWETATTFKVMGDWFLYAAIVGGGQIAYEPTAVSYFRIHRNNTSGKKTQRTRQYFEEYFRVMRSLKENWPIPSHTLSRFIASSHRMFKRANLPGVTFDSVLNEEQLAATRRRHHHILIGLMGFSYGGGEIFPVHLANALRRIGVTVSILQMHSRDDEPDVRRLLDPSIPVYSVDHVMERGPRDFLERTGVSLVHSHVATVDRLFLDGDSLPCAYMSTLHGSYEAMRVPKTKVYRWSKRVGRFAYLADRNLSPFYGLEVPQQKFLKVRNALPPDHRAFPKTRADLDIQANAVVFCLASRAVEGKGWSEAVKAYLRMRIRRPDVPTALLLAGDGEKIEEAKQYAADEATIHFLGFVSEVSGLYRMADVALLPSRYPGESFPLTLIQAFQAGTPCIATDIGEIKGMSTLDGNEAGIIFTPTDDNEIFVQSLSLVMEKMLDNDVRSKFRDNAILVGKSFDMDQIARTYLQEYVNLVEEFLG